MIFWAGFLGDGCFAIGYFAPEAQSTFGAFGPFAVIARAGRGRRRRRKEKGGGGKGKEGGGKGKEGGRRRRGKGKEKGKGEGGGGRAARRGPLASGPCFFLAGALPFLGNLYLCLLMGWLGPFLSFSISISIVIRYPYQVFLLTL